MSVQGFKFGLELVRGSVSVMATLRDLDKESALKELGDMELAIRTAYQGGRKVGQTFTVTFEGEQFTLVGIDQPTRDNAITGLRASVRQAANRLKKIENHWCAEFIVRWTAKNGFFTEERPEDKGEGAGEGAGAGEGVGAGEGAGAGEGVTVTLEKIQKLEAENSRLREILAQINAAKNMVEIKKLLAA